LKSGSHPGAAEIRRQADGGGIGAAATFLRNVAPRRTRRTSAVLLLALAAALPIVAQQTRVYREGESWVEETTGTIPVARELRISTELGSVEVRGNARGIAYTVRKRSFAATKEQALREFQMMKITAANLGNTALLEGRLLHQNLTRFTAEFSMQVPTDLEKLRLDTGAGAMAISALGAAVIGKTGAGAVKLDNIAGPVNVTTGGGEVTASTLGSEALIKSGGGDVRVQKIGGTGKITTGGGRVFVGSARALTVQDDAGAIEVQKCSGDLQASAGGGNLDLGDIGGSVRVDAGAGSVHLASAKGPVQVSTGGGSVELFKVARSAQVETGAGAITVEFVGSPGAFADSSLHTAAGDVRVFLPGNLPVTVHASSEMAPGYGIRSGFNDIHVTKQGGGWGPQSMWAEGVLNGGGPLLRIRTNLGHIDLLQLQSH
jgi:hypothetical protein